MDSSMHTMRRTTDVVINVHINCYFGQLQQPPVPSICLLSVRSRLSKFSLTSFRRINTHPTWNPCGFGAFMKANIEMHKRGLLRNTMEWNGT